VNAETDDEEQTNKNKAGAMSRKSRVASAQVQREKEKELKEKEKEKEKERVEAASRRKGRAEKRHAEGTVSYSEFNSRRTSLTLAQKQKLPKKHYETPRQRPQRLWWLRPSLRDKLLHLKYLPLARRPRRQQVHHIARMLGHNRKGVASAGTNTHEIEMQQKTQQVYLDRPSLEREERMEAQLLPRMDAIINQNKSIRIGSA